MDMGVADVARDTAGSVAGAGAQILIEGGHAAGTLAKAVWTAPPLKIPISYRVKKGVKVVEYLEIPPAILLGGAMMFAAYCYFRQKKDGFKPFDWLWQMADTGGLLNKVGNQAGKVPGGIQSPASGPVGTDHGGPYSLYIFRLNTDTNPDSWEVRSTYQYYTDLKDAENAAGTVPHGGSDVWTIMDNSGVKVKQGKF